MKVFTIFFSSFFLASVAAVNHTTRAEQLGLNNTWVAPMPPDQIDAEATDQFLINNWYTANKNIYGGSGISFVNNPTTINDTTAANNDSAVLRVAYPVGSYAPVGTKSESGKVGGVEFVSDPNNGVFYDEALLTYDLLFDQNFDWVKGGKLPGIYGGSPKQGCSGGVQPTGSNCFSIRLMWRAGGAGEAYAYVPTTDEICKEKQVICNSDYGTSISRGVIRFNTQNWTRIEIYMKLNTGSNQDGVLEVWQDESLRINRRDMLYRTTDAMGISNMMFSTFFGGGTPDYASPVDTYAYFKNIQYSTGNPTKPTEGRATILAPSATIVACLVLSIAFSLL